MIDRKKVQPLIDQMGEAISETMNESIPIAVIVEKFKKEGYEIFLILEATIGFQNGEGIEEISQIPPAVHESEPLVKDGEVVPDAFTAQDKKIFKSMKIVFDDKNSPKK